MHWFKRDLWKAGIAIAGTLLLLVLMVWVPVSVAGAYEGASRLATPITGTVQATPTVDATVTALNKEKLAQEVQQLKNQNAPDPLGWLQTNASILLSTLFVVIGALIGAWQWGVGRRDAQDKELEDRKAERDRREEEQKRWLEDRKAERERRDEEQLRWLKDQEAEREKRAEERFQSAVEGLGSEREGARVGAAITLRTFLLSGYEQFYRQVFDLVVAHLRLPRTSKLLEDENIPVPLTSLSQALVVVFKEAFPLARSQNTRSSQSLDATGIQLDNAYLREADLKQVWMPQASLRNADLKGATLIRANLFNTQLCEASLSGANLSEATLIRANLCKTWFRLANLTRANLSGANLSGANLSGADLSEANLEEALSLKDTNIQGVKGLTKEQLEACKAKGAIIDEAPTTSSPQSPVSPPPSSQSNDAQAPSVRSTPTADADGSSPASSQQGPEA